MIQDFVKPHKISAVYLYKQKSVVPKKKCGHVSNFTVITNVGSLEKGAIQQLNGQEEG